MSKRGVEHIEIRKKKTIIPKICKINATKEENRPEWKRREEKESNVGEGRDV